MGRVVRFEQCPKCAAAGRDKHRDNLGIYVDGSVHCFANCGYHRHARTFVPRKAIDVNEDKAVLPADFSREIPARGWRWLLQFGLPYTYWLPFVGFSAEAERLIITVGRPTKFSIGRYIGETPKGSESDPAFRKWKLYGDRHRHIEVLGEEHSGPVVLVEDVVSAHKVAQVATCIPLFGTKTLDGVIKELIRLKRPVVLWLDADQYTLLAPKLNRLRTFLRASVRHIKTEKDPKDYDLPQIKEFLSETVRSPKQYTSKALA